MLWCNSKMLRRIIFSVVILVYLASLISCETANTSTVTPEEVQDLLKGSTSAFKIWNITNYYRIFNINNTNETCINELKSCHNAIPFYLINITIEETKDYLRYYYRHNDVYYDGNEISFAREALKHRSMITKDMDLYLEIASKVINLVVSETKEIVTCADNNCGCGCIFTETVNDLEYEIHRFKEKTSFFWEYILFGVYIEPICRITIIITGLIFNGALVFIFIREEHVRTESNVLIFHQIVNNILMLTVYLPMNYVGTYHLESYFDVNGYISIQIIIVSLNALTILLLNIQRLVDVSRVLTTSIQSFKLKPVVRCSIYISCIWIWSVFLGIIFAIMDHEAVFAFESLVYFLLYLFVLSIVLAVLNSITSRKLQGSAQDGQALSELKFITGSTVILSLTLVFYISHTLFFVYTIFEITLDEVGARMGNPLTSRIIIFILHLIFFSYPISTVVALYKSSNAFRTYLRKYVLKCWYQPDDDEYVTMSPAQQNTEALAFAHD